MFSYVVLVLNNIDSEIILETKRWRVRGTELAARMSYSISTISTRR